MTDIGIVGAFVLVLGVILSTIGYSIGILVTFSGVIILLLAITIYVVSTEGIDTWPIGSA